jgi:hypothetical protein
VQEVFLFERLQAHPHQEDLRHLKCIVIARPEDSVSLLCTELANPRYYEISGNWILFGAYPYLFGFRIPLHTF